jgi:hypothetical protein
MEKVKRIYTFMCKDFNLSSVSIGGKPLFSAKESGMASRT